MASLVRQLLHAVFLKILDSQSSYGKPPNLQAMSQLIEDRRLKDKDIWAKGPIANVAPWTADRWVSDSSQCLFLDRPNADVQRQIVAHGAVCRGSLCGELLSHNREYL